MSITANIASRFNDYQSKLIFMVLDNITVPLPHKLIHTQEWKIPTHLADQLADPTFFIPSTIDLLISAEIFYSVILSGQMRLAQNLPYMKETVFGWLVTGPLIEASQSPNYTPLPQISLFTSSTTTDNLLTRFWEQEEIQAVNFLSPEEKYCENSFQSTTTVTESGQYTVNLPLQQDKLPDLDNNFNTAYRCLLQLESRFQKDHNLYLQYKQFLDEFVQLGHAQYITNFSPYDSNATTLPLTCHSYLYECFLKQSSFTKLIRIVAFMFRFVHNIRNKSNKQLSHLNVTEMKEAHDFIIRVIQLNSFPKEIIEIQSTLTNTKLTQTNLTHNNRNDTSLPTHHKMYTYKPSPLRKLNPFLEDTLILRVGGRIQHANIPFQHAHPIILPSNNHLTSLVIQYHHLKLLHSGIQNTLANIRLKYWPINGRNEVKKVIHSCTRCTRFRAQVCGQQMANLPAPRVTLHNRAFIHVGMDLSGAIAFRSTMTRNCKYTKAYICLFICLATRAIHLELVSDLTSQAFIYALKRFVSRRGLCSHLYSDNATNFKGSSSELHDLYKMFKNETSYSEIIDFCAVNSIQYKFTVPLASHMGGIYEAGIKSVKSLLKRHLFSTKLTYELLYTVLVQIEGVLNSRPLCPISDLPNDLTCLTPSHFIIGTVMTDIPEPSVLNIKETRLSIYQRIMQIKQKFWKEFYYNYLSELQPRNKWLQIQSNLKIGDLVVIKEEVTPPTSWPLGRVISVNKNRNDNLIRSVVVRTSKGEYTRPIHKLVLLE